MLPPEAIRAHRASRDEPAVHPSCDEDLRLSPRPPQTTQELEPVPSPVHSAGGSQTGGVEASSPRGDLEQMLPPPATHPSPKLGSPVGSQTGDVEMSSPPRGDLEHMLSTPPATQPSPKFYLEATPGYHLRSPLSPAPTPTPYKESHPFPKDLLVAFEESGPAASIEQDLLAAFEESVPTASMEAFQSPMKTAAQQEPAGSSNDPAPACEQQMVISEWPLEECEDPNEGAEDAMEEPSRRRKDRASSSTPAKPDQKKSKCQSRKAAREAKSKESMQVCVLMRDQCSEFVMFGWPFGFSLNVLPGGLG